MIEESRGWRRAWRQNWTLQWGLDQLIEESPGRPPSGPGRGGPLQWGLDQLIEESLETILESGDARAMLQWGLDQLIEESREAWLRWHHADVASMGPRSIDRGINRGRDRHTAGRSASMGPRSIDRGILPIVQAIDALCPLQWGLDQLIEESCGRRKRRGSRSRFNGASIN